MAAYGIFGLVLWSTLSMSVGTAVPTRQERLLRLIDRYDVVATASGPGLVFHSPRGRFRYSSKGAISVSVEIRNAHLLLPPDPRNASSGLFINVHRLRTSGHDDMVDWHDCVAIHTASSVDYTSRFTVRPGNWTLQAYLSSKCATHHRSEFDRAGIRDEVVFEASDDAEGVVVDNVMLAAGEGEAVEPSRLAEHLSNALQRSLRDESELSPSVLELEGMSGSRFRHFLNNLLDHPGARYLEVGLWAGSTFCSALSGNALSLAVGVDNWSEFGGPRDKFLSALQSCRGQTEVHILEMHYKAAGLDLRADRSQMRLGDGFDFYLFDGPHYFDDQYVAISHFFPLLAREAVVVVDDFSWLGVEVGTRAALADLEAEGVLQVVHQAGFLPATSDDVHWHNGIMAFVVRRIAERGTCRGNMGE